MNLRENFEKSLSDFITNEPELLIHNISERSISNKLAKYLELNFVDFNVDTEYNGDIENSESFRKQINISKEEMLKIAARRIDENDTYNVFPDIIIHTRLKNINNHLVVEIKKKNSDTKAKNFDELKLKAFTTQYKYRLGIYLEFKTGINFEVSCKNYFQNGLKKYESQLIDFTN